MTEADRAHRSGRRPRKGAGPDSGRRGRACRAHRVLAALCALGGCISLVSLACASVAFAATARDDTATSAGIFAALVLLELASCALFARAAVQLLGRRCERAEKTAWALAVLMVLQVVAALMLFGLSPRHLGYLAQLLIVIAVASYLDPLLADERARWRLKRIQLLADAEGRADSSGAVRSEPEERPFPRGDRPERGFVKLNFFNLFWIFVVCSAFGLAVETLYHVVVVDPFHYQDRAGLLFGPFSPIYGFGAVLMTVALNRFHDRPVWLVFLVSAVIGGAFEYATSWVMQFAFGLVAWDYSGTFLSIGGRTNGMFMAMWGVLGVLWIKLFLPLVLKLVRLIPWRWRYGVTAVCAALMLVDGVMTLQSIDCWYERESGKPVDTPVERFYADHFGDAYMQDRFQSMSMNVSRAARVDR